MGRQTLYQAESVPLNNGGYLVVRKPWPAMMRNLWGDPDRYVQQYWSKWKDGTSRVFCKKPTG